MPTYEYYRQIYTQDRRRVQQQAIEIAYQELMLQYKEQVRAQEAALSMLKEKRELQARFQLAEMRAAGSVGRGTGGDSTTVTSKTKPASQLDIFKQKAALQKEHNDIQDKNLTRIGDAEERAEAMFEIPPAVRSRMETVLAEIKRPLPETFNQLVAPHVIGVIGGMKDQDQGLALYAEYGRRLQDEADGRFNDVATLFGVPKKLNGHFYTPEEAAQLIALRKKKVVSDVKATGLIDIKPTEDLLESLERFETANRQTTVKTKTTKGTPSKTTTPTTDTQLAQPFDMDIPEIAPIPVPTREDVLARAADIYQPSGGFRARDAFMQDFEGRKQAAVTEEVKSQVPAWARPMIPLQPKVQGIQDKSYSELRSMGVPEQHAVQMIETGKMDMPSMISSVQNNASLDASQKERALIVLGAEQMRRHRANKAQSEELK